MARRMILIAAAAALIIGCGKSTPSTLTEQGLHQLRSGQYAEAIQTCTQAIVANPQDAEAYLYRGRAYQNRAAPGDVEKAMADFTEAIRLAPNDADAYYSRAIVYRDMGEIERAVADDQAARAADNHLQNIYSQLPDFTEQGTLARVRQQLAKDKETEQEKSGNQASGAPLPRSEDEQQELYEKLKERYEPEFGTMHRGSSEADEGGGSVYDALRRPASEQGTGSSLYSTLPDEDALLRTRQRDWLLSPPPAQGSQPSQGNAFQDASPVTPLPDTGTSARALPQSPFAPRTESTTPGATPPVASPFPQRGPSSTGVLRQPATETQSIGPFSRQAPRTVNPYSNPAVRPPNPRDFVP